MNKETFTGETIGGVRVHRLTFTRSDIIAAVKQRGYKEICTTNMSEALKQPPFQKAVDMIALDTHFWNYHGWNS